MFALRGIAVSLAFFVLLYCLLSALVAAGWRLTKLLHLSERRLVALFFGLRVLPFTAALIVTLGFVVPSFQLLEPRSIHEGAGTAPLLLGICALLLILCGSWRVIAALLATSRVVGRWSLDARAMSQSMSQSMSESMSQSLPGPHTMKILASSDAPPLMLVGVRKPIVLVSDSAVGLLSADELRVALEHERSHMRSRDNLKKLIFRFCPFPGMHDLERAWSQSAELVSDDAAVTSVDDALALASALIKLSRLLPFETSLCCTVGFVTGSIHVRVSRLLAWEEAGESDPISSRSWFLAAPALATLPLIFAGYGPALRLIHEATEWLVR